MVPPSDRFHGEQARRLIPVFVSWKVVLLLITAFSPGPGYDTSALIISHGSRHRHAEFATFSVSDQLALNHLRWDALYFVKAAQQGYLYEQEWAFSRTFSTILGFVTNYLRGERDTSLYHYVWIGVILSNIFHLISTLVLYRLLRIVTNPQQNPHLPFIACVLHIISPAGLFLSAPYAEGLFSALNFTGMLHYVLARSTARSTGKWTIYQDSYMLSSGLLFASAVLIRSNGLLSGLVFLYDVVSQLPTIFAAPLNQQEVRRVIVTCVSGGMIALALVVPQFLAYKEYCGPTTDLQDVRPWCHKTVPSIYSWVQSHYWNVGFFRYWTLSNLPLFLLAAPMLWLMSRSALAVLCGLQDQPIAEVRASQNKGPVEHGGTELKLCDFPQLALPQLILVIMAATNFHVQIINRISSGYPIWYLVVAKWTADQNLDLGQKKQDKLSPWVIRGMAMYAIIQGALFAGFLPPA